ncbi:MAG: YiiX/YebB-like N1pC/P60 family cysteine hydrolase, partial [Candidatus Marinimicrobia bacterium]|nr:YiiX/YebB-like N1pC/P60 family cysteine hydrolase [Candidatus Neomarinimicrobiota bacterium]
NYQPQIEYALVWRVRAIRTYSALSEKSVLKASDINYLNYAANRYKDLRETLLEGIARFAPLTNENVKLIINDSSPSIFYQKKKVRQLFSGKSTEIIQINPRDEVGKSVIKKVKLGLTFALLLYDNYLVAVAPYEEHNKLRYIINESGIDPEVEGYLRIVSESYTDRKKMQRLIKAIEFISKIEQWESDHPNSGLMQNDPDNQYLNMMIYGSPSYGEIRKNSSQETESIFSINKINIFNNKIEDNIRLISSDATNQVSKMFGNAAGIIVARRGKMDKLPKEKQSEIIANMQPLDILLEKAPFRLTDHLIPGYWSHVALWSGTENELRELGVWDELPTIYNEAKEKYHYSGPDFQEAIRNGHMVIEALRPGVQINTLQHFLNIDDLGVLRFNGLTIENKRSYLLNAFSQIGKSYDFNFDVESKNEIVCSELIYISFDDLDWNTSKTAGRYTISPDNVAQKLLDDNMDPVLLYINGEELTENIGNVFPIE